MDELDLGDLFEAGARSVAVERGLCEKDASAVASMCKQARRRRMRDDDDEDDGETWWSRNKGWALPSAIGLGSFLLGGTAGRYGRPDRNHFSNAGRLFYEAVQKLLGIPNSALWRSMTKADPSKIVGRKSREERELEDLLSSKYDVPKTEGGAKGPLFRTTVGGQAGEVGADDRALVIGDEHEGAQDALEVR